MFRFLSKALAIGLVLGAASTAALAQTRSFTFGTHEARTVITFVGEAEIETITGTVNKLSGKLEVDGEAPKAGAKLSVDLGDLKTGIELRDEHLRGENWLDAAKHPKIDFELSSLSLRSDGKSYDFKGNMTIKGKTKAVSGIAKLKFVSAEKAEKFKLGAGEWVNVKTSFELQLSDFGVTVPEGTGAKVSNTWQVSIDIWGTTQP
ncbi:MAG: YceI family protein [Myxococcota bacterium]|jgi:polyisoprenoid-binding protein YceI|nr:YceI family protein [Myxococcota bacterium]